MSKTKKILMGAAMSALLPAAAAVASPLVNVRLVLNGTQAGVGNDGDSVANISGSNGQTINVRLETQLGAIGAANATMGVTITSKTDYDGSNAATSDGVNSARFDVRQSSGDSIQADFDSGFTLSSEAQGTGNTGGTLVTRGTSTASSVDPNDLQGVKAVDSAAGTPFLNSANAWRTFATGVLKITNGSGSSGTMTPQLSASSLNAPGLIFINGHTTVTPTYANQNTGTDKPFAYQGLSLVSAPEPASIGLLGMAAVAFIRRRRQA